MSLKKITIPAVSDSKSPIAYLTGFYARAGDAFIRREIEELRRLGWIVHTFSIRRADAGEQVSEDILREQATTFYILEQGVWRLGMSFISMTLRFPMRMMCAINLARQIRWQGIKSVFWHCIYLMEASCLADQLLKRDVKLLHNHIAMNSGTVAMLASVLADIPFSMTVHGPHEFFEAERWGLGTKIAASALTVCISDFGKSQCMLFSHHNSWQKLKVVHCGLDSAFLHSVEPIPIETHNLIYVGRLDPEKGLSILVDAVSSLKNQGIIFTLFVVGDGVMRKELEAHVSQLGLQETIRFLGWQGSQEVQRLILQCRAMVLPSFAEGIPVVLMESMALQRPVIATQVAGIPELVQNGVNGWLVSASSVEEIAVAMREALQASPETLAEMGKRGRRRVLERHAIETEAGKLSDLFAGVSGVTPKIINTSQN